MAARKRTEQPATESGETGAQLKTCPVCGEEKGAVASSRGSRFPFAVQCRACGWSTDFVKLPGIAAKLWNEAKRKRK